MNMSRGIQLTSDTSEVQDATKLDYSNMGLKGECCRMYVPLYKSNVYQKQFLFYPVLILYSSAGELPSFYECKKLTRFYCESNQFTGNLFWQMYTLSYTSVFSGAEIGCWVGLLRSRGCTLDVEQLDRMLLISDTSEVQDATKLDYSCMRLKGEY